MIKIENENFRDEHGRRLILRGVNLGGSSKVPAKPNIPSYVQEGFFDHRNVSFVGRPFPLEEADEHFGRLKAWGLDFLRFLVTWEAIEHEGPGIYDQEYLDYIYEIIKKAGEYDIQLFIDPHQDVWSRFSGGDGAPGWTFEAAGMDITGFADTGAAIVHNTHGDPFPRMIWGTNYNKLAAATMFTLFFGGNDFAPKTKVDGEPIQEYLQRHYLEAVKQVAHRVKDLPNVVGFDILNELSHGFIGWSHLDELQPFNRNGLTPSPFQGMALGDGYPQEVEEWSIGLTGVRKKGTKKVDPKGTRAWLEGCNCIWREHGVWDLDDQGNPELLQPYYFKRVNGEKISFNQDYLRPFINRFTREIREVVPETLIFVEHDVMDNPPQLSPEETEGMVYAQHWYDIVVLMFKKYLHWVGLDVDRKLPVIGPKQVERSFVQQLYNIKERGKQSLNGAPTLIGEIGIAYDLDNKRAFQTGNFSKQIKAMNRSMRAVELNNLSCTIWNYTADNTNERGDHWNDEDLSIFSRDQQDNPVDINSGGRALQAVIRPYARKIPGRPLYSHFDPFKRVFKFVFRHDPEVQMPTELFLPSYHYDGGCKVEVSDGTYEIDRENQVLTYHHTSKKDIHRVVISPAKRRG